MDKGKGKGVLVIGGLGLGLGLTYLLTRRVGAAAPPPPLIYVCDICGDEFNSAQELADHYAEYHPEEPPPPPPPPPECIDGEPYCVFPNLYQCINGTVVLIKRNAEECGYVPPPPPPEFGYIDGMVYESGYGGIEGIHIVADDMQSSMSWEAWTDQDGNYLIDNLPIPAEGSLYLKIRYNKEGYSSASITTTLNAANPYRTKTVSLTSIGGDGNGGATPIAYRDITGLVHGAEYASPEEIGPTVPMAGVAVTLVLPERRTTSTDRNGIYTFANVPLYHPSEIVGVTGIMEGYEAGTTSDMMTTASPAVVVLRPIYMKILR